MKSLLVKHGPLHFYIDLPKHVVFSVFVNWVVDLGGLVKVLEEVYPQVEWDPKKFLPVKKVQHILFDLVKALFPNAYEFLYFSIHIVIYIYIYIYIKFSVL